MFHKVYCLIFAKAKKAIRTLVLMAKNDHIIQEGNQIF